MKYRTGFVWSSVVRPLFKSVLVGPGRELLQLLGILEEQSSKRSVVEGATGLVVAHLLEFQFGDDQTYSSTIVISLLTFTRCIGIGLALVFCDQL